MNCSSPTYKKKVFISWELTPNRKELNYLNITKKKSRYTESLKQSFKSLKKYSAYIEYRFLLYSPTPDGRLHLDFFSFVRK